MEVAVFQYSFIYKNRPMGQFATPSTKSHFTKSGFPMKMRPFLECTAKTGWAIRLGDTAYLWPNGFLEAPAKLGLSSHRIDMGNNLLVGVGRMYRLRFLDGMSLVRQLGLAWLSFFYLLACWAINSWNLMDLDGSLRRVLHMNIDYVGRKFH